MLTDRIGQAIEQITATPDPVRLAKIAELAGRASDAAETRRAPLDPIMDEIEALTGFREEPRYWASFHGGGGPEEFAAVIALPLPEPITDLEPAEIGALLALEESLRLGDQAVYLRILQYLSACLGEAFSTALIYWPHRAMDAAELLDEVVRRRSILRENGSAGLRAYERGLAVEVMDASDSPLWARTWATGVLKRD
ncbi:MAG: hypothetical protein C0471_13925 [Erythrobacter sp.]|nr:hypothetical protein [Erythrobacter sp.]